MSLNARSRVCATEAPRTSTTPAFARIPLILALALGGALLPATPAAADGTIYAVISLTNNTNQTIQIPFSGAHTPQLWGTEGNTLDLASEYIVMPDGSPPRILGPGQTMLWGTKSNGGFLATTGTGGSLSIPSANATITWSVPWSFFNGGFPRNPLTEASA